jgi:hypothetical protein
MRVQGRGEVPVLALALMVTFHLGLRRRLVDGWAIQKFDKWNV